MVVEALTAIRAIYDRLHDGFLSDFYHYLVVAICYNLSKEKQAVVHKSLFCFWYR